MPQTWWRSAMAQSPEAKCLDLQGSWPHPQRRAYSQKQYERSQTATVFGAGAPRVDRAT
jgi:hypothetical protein